jgi:SAM-dependent methyltransferase
MSARRRLKPVLGRIGIHSAEPLWLPLALRAHRAKLARDPAYRAWLESAGREAIRRHWGEHDPVRGEFFELHLASQVYEITETLRARIGDPSDDPVLDAGASDGLFLARIGARRGVGLNLLDHCVAQIAADGFEAVAGDIEAMPFEDGQFATVICCETLEHVPNPVKTLNELARVCRGRIHLTIPWLPRTRISARPDGWPHVESHIFEFSEADFGRVVTHAGVRVVHRGSVDVFPEPRNPLVRAWLGVLMYPNFFPRLQYYELEPA